MSDAKPTATLDETEVGNYFVSNYPPFSCWRQESVSEALAALAAPPGDTPLGLYLHIPFCRKRCHFCYFRVYIDKNARDVKEYLDVLVREWELYNEMPAVAERPLNFIYFGGGTPSYLSVRQLQSLVERLQAIKSWDSAEEITFECEPGTLTESKLSAIRDLGITRLSLGIENFGDEILELNGRAHLSKEIYRSYEFARSIDFPQINIDLIAGMLGETDENWTDCVEQTIALAPDSVTIYQMELPFNTTISRDVLEKAGRFEEKAAGWSTKRRWVDEAFRRLEAAGYTVGSAYTAIKDPGRSKFVYRDRLWQGADLLPLGVASFGHIAGVHMQNLDTWETYCPEVQAGRLPLNRALKLTDDERLIREFILQLKLGAVRPAYFQEKFGVDIQTRFAEPLDELVRKDLCAITPERIELTREALLRVDSLLPAFFLPEHRELRYT